MQTIKIDVELPKGWVFYSSDASMSCTTFGTIPPDGVSVMLRRDVEDTRKWQSLSEEDRGNTPLYAASQGGTLTEALLDAIRIAEEIGPL